MMRKFMVKNSNKPCDKECLLIRECLLVMLLAPTTPILGKDIAQPWGVASLEFEGAEA